mmetsp:Transcript_44239/g.139567  ORF Transcript_44239/g.139567 Transcript_44239/m.139567 type:complete len:219 (-) Transcript_44239:175-831(-)
MQHCLVGPRVLQVHRQVLRAVEDDEDGARVRVGAVGVILEEVVGVPDVLRELLVEGFSHHPCGIALWAGDERKNTQRDHDGEERVHDAADRSLHIGVSDLWVVERHVGVVHPQREEVVPQRHEVNVLIHYLDDAMERVCLRHRACQTVQRVLRDGGAPVQVHAVVEAARAVAGDALDVLDAGLDEVDRCRILHRLTVRMKVEMEGHPMPAEIRDLEES